MMPTESSGRDAQGLSEIALESYQAFETDDEDGTAARGRSTFADLCRATTASDCDASPRYRHLNGDRDDEEQPGVVAPMAAHVLGSASKCLATTAAHLDPEAMEEQELPRVTRDLPRQKPSTINSLAKVAGAVLCFLCALVVLHSHFNGVKATVLEGEIKRLQTENEALEMRAQLFKQEKEDLSSLLLDPKAKKRLINMVQRSKAFNEFIAEAGFESRVENTHSVRQCLTEIFHKFQIRSILDVPCGDASWQHAVEGIGALTYVGADINPKALEAAQQLQQNQDMGMQFMLFDAVHFPLRRSFDLVLFRDILEQQRIQDTLTAVLNFNQSGSRYIAASYWPSSPSEANDAGFWLRHAGWYEANLLQTPFSFPEPLYSCDNVDVGSPHRGLSKLGVWALKDLPVTRRSVLDAEEVARHPPLHLMPKLPQVHIIHLPSEASHHEADVSFNNLLKFFGLKPAQFGTPVQHKHPDAPAEAPADPVKGLFSDFLETRGPLRDGQPPHRPSLLKDLFNLPDFKPGQPVAAEQHDR